MATANFQSRLMGLQANLLNFAFMLTSNRDDAYDLLQDTTLKALDNADKYVENTNFKGWVFTIMRNIFINNYRRVVRSATVIDQTDDLYHLNLSQDSGLETPEGSFGAKEITDAINEFPDKYRIP
ncbi:RNA polymerase sigma factor, partial [Paramuribaculum intestinale]